MTRTSLEELVQQARRERPAPGALSAVARGLRVPFVVAAPLAAVVVPSSAAASVLAKLGLSRLSLLGWGAGSAVAASGVIAAVALTQPSAPAPSVPPAPVVALPRKTPLPAQPAPAPVVATEPPPITSPERRAVREIPAVWDEPQLIERARKALSAEPRQALSLAQEHQRRFPSGALGLEREVILIEALARTGQTNAARRRALSFESKYPQSIHLPRVRALRERLGG